MVRGWARERRRALTVALVGGFVAGAGVVVVREAWSLLFDPPRISGEVRVIDGDSLVVGGHAVRLLGVDAPELRQTCRRAGEDWRCGMAAADRLRALVEAGPVECRLSGRDRNGRKLGRCRAGRIADLGERLVRDGWALSYDASYLDQERAAARERQGIWTAVFERPREWRRARQQAAAE